MNSELEPTEEFDGAVTVRVFDDGGTRETIRCDTFEEAIETVRWNHARRRLSVDVEGRECPYDNVACVADDRCIECQMDAVQRES